MTKEQIAEIDRLLDLVRNDTSKSLDVAELLFDEMRGEGYTREMCEHATVKSMQGQPLEHVIDYLETHLKLHKFLYWE